jgi:hypothetical protein
VALLGTQAVAGTALADPAGAPQVQEPAPGLQHNIIYRARADGTSRGAVVSYKQDDRNVNSAQPTMLPGQTFEVNTVLTDPKRAGMELSIQWPYGSNLHCEILVDDQIVAQADQFIAPRLFRVKDDPLYGTLQCGAPLDIPVAGTADTPPPQQPAPGVDAPPAQPVPVPEPPPVA